MNLRKYHLIKIAILLIVSFIQASGQEPYRLNDEQTKDLLKRIDKDTETYRSSLKQALKSSRFDGAPGKDINEYMKDFERSVEHLRDKFNDNKSAANVVEDVLRKGARIDDFIASNNLAPQVQDNWMTLRSDLDRLARSYGLNWTWGPAQGEQAFRYTDKDVKYIVVQLDRDAGYFRNTFKKSLDRARVANRKQAEEFAEDFEKAIRNLKDKYDHQSTGKQYVDEVLSRASALQNFIQNNPTSDTVTMAWDKMHSNLQRLAKAYNVDWN